jgi:GNAT superfamily N-acetyltransferase
VVERSIAGSRPYSVYANDQQVAFARVVTDAATFAWICDEFVEQDHRGGGLGTWLVRSIVEDLAVDGVPRVRLATRDAHEVCRPGDVDSRRCRAPIAGWRSICDLTAPPFRASGCRRADGALKRAIRSGDG